MLFRHLCIYLITPASNNMSPSRRALLSYTDAYTLAQSSLDSFDPLRLLAAYSICSCLAEQDTDSQRRAKEMAHEVEKIIVFPQHLFVNPIVYLTFVKLLQAFALANSHTNTNKNMLAEELMQKLRDEFMVFPACNGGIYLTSYCSNEYTDDENQRNSP